MADSQLEDPNVKEDATAKLLDLATPKYNLLLNQTSAKTRHSCNQKEKNNITNSNKSGGTLGIENAIKKAQKKICKEEKEKNAM